MKRIVKIIALIFAIDLMISLQLYSQELNKLPAETYFKNLRNSILENLPESFTGELNGKTIAKKLGSIPKDSYLEKNKRIYVEFRYTKASGIAVEVKNVDELYKDLYKDLPRQLYAFDLILSSKDNDSFTDKYDISYHSTESNSIVIRLNIKSAENNLLLFVNTQTNQIMRIDYAMGKDLLSSTLIGYGNFISGEKKYLIPNRYLSKTYKDSKEYGTETIEIINIKLK